MARERPGGQAATAKARATMRARATRLACRSCDRRLAVMDYADDNPGPRCRFCGWRPKCSCVWGIGGGGLVERDPACWFHGGEQL
ncbi:MAG TPA: hypothetical protein VKB54_06910 [Solirubrobacteraceae bacterium]|nr:hypothetical protein [Solirubrobacteraceae bacterium]